MMIRIASIDDDEGIHASIRMLLKDSKYHYLGGYTTSAAALRQIPRERPHAVFVDFLMPDLTGIELVPRLKRALPTVKAIIVTGVMDPGVFMGFEAAGADGCLLKPFTGEELKGAIQAALVGRPFVDNKLAGILQTTPGSKVTPAWALPRALTSPLLEQWENRKQDGGFLVTLADMAQYHPGKLAVLLKVTLRRANRVWHYCFGRSARDWLERMRMDRAAQMLRQRVPPKQTAVELGYKHPSNFYHDFKRAYDRTPRNFA